MTARCQTFGDWGPPCWDALLLGRQHWTDHLSRCARCRADEACWNRDRLTRSERLGELWGSR